MYIYTHIYGFLALKFGSDGAKLAAGGRGNKASAPTHTRTQRQNKRCARHKQAVTVKPGTKNRK